MPSCEWQDLCARHSCQEEDIFRGAIWALRTVPFLHIMSAVSDSNSGSPVRTSFAQRENLDLIGFPGDASLVIHAAIHPPSKQTVAAAKPFIVTSSGMPSGSGKNEQTQPSLPRYIVISKSPHFPNSSMRRAVSLPQYLRVPIHIRLIGMYATSHLEPQRKIRPDPGLGASPFHSRKLNASKR